MTSGRKDPPARAFTRRSFLKGASAAAVAGSLPLGAHGSPVRRDGKHFDKGLHGIELRINGAKKEATVETRTTLLDALRDKLDLTGAKKICDRGACGGCTVLVDGAPVNACMMLAIDGIGAEITTIEGLSSGPELHPLQQAFVECDALQCGFCTPGMVMAGVACLQQHASPTLEQLQRGLAGNICRCGTYGRIFEAMQRAAPAVRGNPVPANGPAPTHGKKGGPR